MIKTNKFIFFFIISLLLTYFNFYFSNLFTSKLSQGWHFSNALFNITYVENTGAAFSILQKSTDFLIFMSITALMGLFFYLIKHLEKISEKEMIFIAFLTAGILGNLYERISFGYVRDFFELTFINFPIFNISDIFINIGVIGMIILIVFTKKQIDL
jgi:signal peptidase II